MQPADRLSKLPVYLFDALDAQKAAEEAKGVHVIDLGVGDPDRPTPKYIIDMLKQAVDNPKNHHYPSFKGLPEYRRAVAYWYKTNFNVELDPDREIMSCIGSKGGVSALPFALINLGDVVLVPDPCYTAYIPGIVMAGGEVHFMPLLEENEFLPDLAAIPADICERAKLMLLNYPGNPTAALGPLSFFEKVVSFANQHNIVICHDAPYSEAVFDGQRQPSFLETPGAKEVGIEFHSLSKVFNMSGWRIAHACGNADVISYLSKVKSNVDMGIFQPIQHAGIAALTGTMDFTREMCRIYQRRRDVLIEGLNKLGWNVRKNPATFFIWTRVPEPGISSTDFAAKVLKQAGVLITPGRGFGEYGEGYIRIALTVEEDVCRAVVERIQKAGLVY
ncbi:MAG: aminotransferase class I/II-fold pyridoxal phosphate-dependent enzyme [Candidatus Omnitrophota bacterium]|nr:MAG: aminotransferase class I/II-fold pyridoxal phosphate-dependent enzyme [Candidatus Omnitrophota bacterium]